MLARVRAVCVPLFASRGSALRRGPLSVRLCEGAGSGWGERKEHFTCREKSITVFTLRSWDIYIKAIFSIIIFII